MLTPRRPTGCTYNLDPTTHKYFAIVDIVFDDLVDITSYEFITANDNNKRDPSAWTFQSEYAGVWTVLDERFDIAAPVTPSPPAPNRFHPHPPLGGKPPNITV